MSWSRVFCWVAAAVDAAATAVLLSPVLAGRLLGVADIAVTPALSYALRTGASLMAGWTCLLIWASLRPVERRGVVLLTIVPVVAGLMLTEILALHEGFVRIANLAPMMTLQTALAAFGVWSYRRDAARA